MSKSAGAAAGDDTRCMTGISLDTVMLIGPVGVQQPAPLRPVFLAGVWTASCGWFTGLGFGSRLLAPVFARPIAWRFLDVLIAFVMWSIAATLPPGERNAAMATLLVAVFDGLFLELVSTGDRRRTSNALDEFIRLVRRARAGGGGRRCQLKCRHRRRPHLAHARPWACCSALGFFSLPVGSWVHDDAGLRIGWDTSSSSGRGW